MPSRAFAPEARTRLQAAVVVGLLVVMPAFLGGTLLIGNLFGHGTVSGAGVSLLGAGAVISVGAAMLAGYVAFRASETVVMWCIGVALLASIASVAWIFIRMQQEAAITLETPDSAPASSSPLPISPP